MSRLKRIMEELNIDVPVMGVREEGEELVLELYGGRVVRYKSKGKGGMGKEGKGRRRARRLGEEEMEGDKIAALRSAQGLGPPGGGLAMTEEGAVGGGGAGTSRKRKGKDDEAGV